MINRPSLSFIGLAGILIITVMAYNRLAHDFHTRINTRFIRQEQSFPYYLKPGKEEYSLILGDLNGLNKNAYLQLLSFVEKKQPPNPSWIVVPSLMPRKSQAMPDEIKTEDLLEQISNDKGVVLVDNFCSSGWPALAEKAIYKISRLSPGGFCLSEPETRGVHQLIKQFQIKKAYLVYDTESYRSFVANVLQYLKENNIPHEFVQSQDAQAIEKYF